MPKPLSPAQRANQITFVLKGHLKNVQLSYLRVGAGLAQIRDQRLYAALKYDSLESYARARLGLGRAAVYRYSAAHLRRITHPGAVGVTDGRVRTTFPGSSITTLVLHHR